MSCDLQFCPHCNNLLYPKEDRDHKQLMFFCHTCNFLQYADPFDLMQNTVDVQSFNFRSKSDVHSYIVPGLADDPTLPREPSWRCPKCSEAGAVFFQLPERVADDAMTLVFVCVHCTYYEVKGKEADDAFAVEGRQDDLEEMKPDVDDEDDEGLFGDEANDEDEPIDIASSCAAQTEFVKNVTPPTGEISRNFGEDHTMDDFADYPEDDFRGSETLFGDDD